MYELDAFSFGLGILTYLILGVSFSLIDFLSIKTHEIRGRIADQKKDGSKGLPRTFADYKKDSSK